MLDNFEQVLEAAPIVADLLGACPDVTVLATGSARLRVSEERELDDLRLLVEGEASTARSVEVLSNRCPHLQIRRQSLRQVRRKRPRRSRGGRGAAQSRLSPWRGRSSVGGGNY